MLRPRRPARRVVVGFGKPQGRAAEAVTILAEHERRHPGAGVEALGRGRIDHLGRDFPAPEEALRHLEEAMRIAEGLRWRSREVTSVQQGVFVRSGPLYERAVGLLHELHRRQPGRGLDRRAFAIAQRSKGRSLLDLLAEAEVDLRIRADPEFLLGEEVSHLWAVTRESLRFVRLPPREVLERETRALLYAGVRSVVAALRAAFVLTGRAVDR